jgi:hypothetical protein
MKVLSVLWRRIAAAVGVVVVARTYNEAPAQQVPAASRTPDGARVDGLDAEKEANSNADATTTGALPVGWCHPKPDAIPRPTYWPFIFSVGVALVFWGLISNIFIFGFGFILFGAGLGGWIWDMLNE